MGCNLRLSATGGSRAVHHRGIQGDEFDRVWFQGSDHWFHGISHDCCVLTESVQQENSHGPNG